MKKSSNIGNPYAIATATEILKDPVAMQQSANLVKEVRKTATSGLKTVLFIAASPIIIVGGYFVVKSIVNAINNNSDNKSYEDNLDNFNFQTATLFRNALKDKDEGKIFSTFNTIKYIEDWNEVVQFYSKIYTGKKEKGMFVILDDSGSLPQHIKSVLSDDKWSLFLDNVNKLKSKSNSTEYFLKTKKDTNILTIYDEKYPYKSYPIIKDFTVENGVFEKSVEINNIKYAKLKGSNFPGLKNFGLYIPYNDVVVINRTDYDKLLKNKKYVRIS